MSGTSSRLLTLLSLLQARRDWPGAVLAKRLGVTTRTVRRDVDRLRELGYRIAAFKGPAGGYRLEAGSELPPLLFDDAQAVAIAVALQNASASGVDIAEASQRALATIRQVMPSRLRHRIDGIDFSRVADSASVDPGLLETVSTSIKSRMELRFTYGDRDDTWRRVEPHGLVARNGRWYLLGWDHDRVDWRIYRLDRMHLRIPTGPRFKHREIPLGDAGRFVDARAKGSSEHDSWPCRGVVEIELPAAEVIPWVHDGEVEVRDESSCRVTIGSWSWVGLLATITRFEAPFVIVGPPELIEASRAVSQRLADAIPREPPDFSIKA